MTITVRGYPTHFVSQNKQICIWHCRLTHISNARVIRASKLVEGINLALTDKKYDPMEVLINSEDFDMFEDEITDSQSNVDINPPLIIVASAYQDDNEMDKLCAPYIESKSTQVMRQNKTITPTTEKLEKVHTDLWGPHNPLSQSGIVYAAIFICKHTQRT